MGTATTEEILTGVCHLDGSLFLNMKIKEEKMKPIQFGKHNLNNILNPLVFMFFCYEQQFVNEHVLLMILIRSLSILNGFCNTFFKNHIVNFKAFMKI